MNPAPALAAKWGAPRAASASSPGVAAGKPAGAASAARILQEAMTLHQAGRFAEAEPLYRQALDAMPEHPEALHLYGMLAHQTGRNESAAELIGKAISHNPANPVYFGNLGSVLLELGRNEDAIDSYRKALALKPDLAEVHYNLGNALRDSGFLDEAAECYRKALAFRPDYAQAYNNLGLVLHEQGKLDKAEACYRKAIKLRPGYAEALCNLGYTLMQHGQLDKALESCREALTHKPDHAEAYFNIGVALIKQGKPEEAINSYRAGLAYQPGNAEANSNLLFHYCYQSLAGAEEYAALARHWETACIPAQERLAARHKTFSRPPLAGRRLRVGYVSGDFRRHAISHFIEQLFTLHDRTRIELFAYSNGYFPDDVTERLRGLAEHWVVLTGKTDADALARIEADEIDVLIDLSGHTAHNRMGVFARRAAPVQAHYLGYMGSTGLTEMDYWIGDDILTPPETDSHFSERVWRLPRVWVSYSASDLAPAPAWQPSPDGSLWLGSFNNLDKLTGATLELWARVLQALPEGRLLLKTKGLSDQGSRQRILDFMNARGVAPERLELQDGSDTPDWQSHMARYDRLDIALDPVGGISGGTTTCDALWMGVPVIGLEGDRMASRMTATMLNAIGHPEWLARSEDEYIEKTAALARDVKLRRTLRPLQRERMAASPLCDARGMANTLESAYIEMFEQWQKHKT